ncbi:hypothetical protein [Cellulomonas fengjieae]|uniref:Uncharacterized protein n=1 Tax=Cellulomonas fengjieae TaxID=2819978 RepID=A0ABS3SHM5_9CELL|nr:hypothetical protein [Cellulomonas fengjieae]MBO3084989.1 hypothetical protein [Cellulomonas fengjieae]MBO3100736.1 hypothetical protein [Cellulomonas fengjieae]QVI66413.1 hypothetical protein KG102_02050 [Cellulomonas fengjieae]
MTRRMPRPGRRTALAAVVGALLLALVGSSLAQASAVSITTRLKPFTTSQSRCTSQAVGVTNVAIAGPTARVVVSGLDPARCAGQPLAVTVYDPAVTTWPAARRLEVTGAVSTSTATLTAPTGTFTPAAGLKVRVTVGGWEVPATWTYTTPIPLVSCTVPGSTSATCSATITTVAGGNPGEYLRTIRVTGSELYFTRWQVTLNLSDPALPFVARSLLDVGSDLVLIGTSGCDANPRTVTVEGSSSWAYDYTSLWVPRTFQVRGYAANQATPMLLNCP